MIEFDRSDGEEDLRGPYHPAGGSGWTKAISTEVTRRLIEIVIESHRTRPTLASIGRGSWRSPLGPMVGAAASRST